jgi:subtilase family serine protease
MSIFTGQFEREGAWAETGGGISRYEARPSYQASIAGIVGTHRGVPDISAVADPETGVWVFNSTFLGCCYWFSVGGTSASSPMWAGIVNAAGSFAASTNAELTKLYARPAKLHDVTNGFCGPYRSYLVGTGWDFCTGLGSPKGGFWK